MKTFPPLVSPHFSIRELQCPCCNVLRLDYKLVCGLELLRQALSLKLKQDTPIFINSGYRCSVHNAKVGGSKASQHLLGKAADIRWNGDVMTLWELAEGVRYFYEGGMGLSKERGFVHVDVRDNGPMRWGYKGGKMAPLEEVLGGS